MDAPFYQRTWIDIDLDALKANYRTAKSLTKATVTCVIKSNAYGHGRGTRGAGVGGGGLPQLCGQLCPGGSDASQKRLAG